MNGYIYLLNGKDRTSSSFLTVNLTYEYLTVSNFNPINKPRNKPSKQ